MFGGTLKLTQPNPESRSLVQVWRCAIVGEQLNIVFYVCRFSSARRRRYCAVRWQHRKTKVGGAAKWAKTRPVVFASFELRSFVFVFGRKYVTVFVFVSFSAENVKSVFGRSIIGGLSQSWCAGMCLDWATAGRRTLLDSCREYVYGVSLITVQCVVLLVVAEWQRRERERYSSQVTTSARHTVLHLSLIHISEPTRPY